MNFGEPGDHCCWLLEIDETSSLAFQMPLESPRLLTVDARAGGDGDALAWDGGLPDLAGAIVKLRIAATEAQARRLPLPDIKARLLEFGARHVWAVQVFVERVGVAAGAAVVDESVDDLQAFEIWLNENLAGKVEGLDGLGIERWVERVCLRHAEYVQAAL